MDRDASSLIKSFPVESFPVLSKEVTNQNMIKTMEEVSSYAMEHHEGL
jgi:hypothetical protein